MTETEKAMLEALKSIADGQKAILEELKKPREEMVPLKMPDGSTQLVPKSSLQASTKEDTPSQMRIIVSNPITNEPWPDPDIPKKAPVR